jgi:hypothetical protein
MESVQLIIENSQLFLDIILYQINVNNNDLIKLVNEQNDDNIKILYQKHFSLIEQLNN